MNNSNGKNSQTNLPIQNGFTWLVQKINDNYQKLYHQKFQTRLQICNLLRRAAFAPNLAKWVISALSLTEKPRELLAKATRSKLPTLAE